MANTKVMQRRNAQTVPKQTVIRYTPLEELLSKCDFQLFAFILLFILCFQPLVGAFINIYDTDGLDEVFLNKANYVRIIGILGLFVFIMDYIKKSCILGNKPWAKQTFLKNPWTILFLATLLIAFFSACGENIPPSVLGLAELTVMKDLFPILLTAESLCLA